MKSRTRWKEMDGNQRRILVDASQLHEAFVEASVRSRSYRGGMQWKKAKGREYLFRFNDRRGYGKSLGPRSPATERTYQEFYSNKERHAADIRRLKERIKEQARFCKAARIARVPKVVGSILRLLEQRKLLGSNLQVIGTNAMYAYEAAAGVVFETDLMATQDVDLLWDVRSRLQLDMAGRVRTDSLLSILQEADRSFELIRKRSFRAVNRDGYMVDLLKPEPRPPQLVEHREMRPGGADLVAAEIRNLQWLLAAPKFAHHVIGEDGYPALMAVPDPRAFALHKLWVSRQPDREAIKRHRDAEQAHAVCMLVLQHLPHLTFSPSELRMFPKTLVQAAGKAIEGIGMPPGY